MKKENRLLKNYDFKNVLDFRKSTASKEFVVYKKNNELSRARIGISVSSKIGNSVVRHKVKRQISNIIRNGFDLSNNVDIVVIVRKNYLNNEFGKNEKILVDLLNKKI